MKRAGEAVAGEPRSERVGDMRVIREDMMVTGIRGYDGYEGYGLDKIDLKIRQKSILET